MPNTEIEKHAAEIAELRTEIRKLRLSRNRMDAQYFLLLLFATVLTALIVARGWAGQPTVSIEYNIGEIIAGILGGGGVAAAGTAYAVTKFRERKDTSE